MLRFFFRQPKFPVIIHMFNTSENSRLSGVKYSERSLSAKRLDRIVREIVGLIQDSNRNI